MYVPMVSTFLRNVGSPKHAHSAVRCLCSAKSKLRQLRLQLRTKVRGSIGSRKLTKRHHRDMARLSSAFMALVGLLVVTLLQGKICHCVLSVRTYLVTTHDVHSLLCEWLLRGSCGHKQAGLDGGYRELGL